MKAPAEYHIHPHAKNTNCHCVVCRPLERPCNCTGCDNLRNIRSSHPDASRLEVYYPEHAHKIFRMTMLDFPEQFELFSGDKPPGWLAGGRLGSTGDNSWFYEGHILPLQVGQSKDTDFRRITRIE